MRTSIFAALALFGALGISLGQSGPARSPPDGDWPVTGGSPGNDRYSALTQIDRGNVDRLQVAWVYHTGDASAQSEMQATPIEVGGILYTTTPSLAAIALRADSGTLVWRFDPFAGSGRPRAS